jgi:ubiquinone/menaquinone biosynthesis C-methylase UbiE
MVREVYHSLLDNFELLIGKRDKSTPPRRLIENIGGGDFNGIGKEFFRHFLDIGKLKPDDCVLDVGCGCGRMAVPLTKYLSAKGGYWGFDIVEESIKWCQKHIGDDHRNFHFLVADVYNQFYHPKGRFKAAEYRFPYLDNFFDMVSLTSVFTHMMSADMQNYLGQISRVLKPGGRCMISFFLLNEESKGMLSQGMATVKLPYAAKDCLIGDKKFPEGAVAFEESFIRQHYATQGLEIMEPIHYGSWCGRKCLVSYQDIIVAVKKPTDRLG